MRLSATLTRYIGLQFLLWFAVMLGGILAVVYLLDTVELLRRAANKPDASFALVVGMGVLKLPEIGHEVFPFIVLFGGMYTFRRLTRTQELVVARASGISAWQFMAPVIATAVVIGALQVGLLNPVFAAMLTRFEQMEDRYLRGQTSSIDVSRSGVWLRQVDGPELGGQGGHLIHADGVVPGTLELRGVMILRSDATGALTGRLDAATAILRPGYWELRQVWVFDPRQRRSWFEATYEVATDLTEERIKESFAPPNTLSFWELPGFIATLEATGLSSVRHRLYWHSLLSQPVLLSAMVLLAGAFALRQSRRGGNLLMVALGIGTALAVFVVQDVVGALGLSGVVPVPLAAWAPAFVSVMLGAAALLHLEDG